MSIRNDLTYANSRFSTDRPIWKWSELFKGVLQGSDIDFHGMYRRRHLYIESKRIGARMWKGQKRNLESIARQPNTDVLFVGTQQVGEDFFTTPVGVVVAWCWIIPDTNWWQRKHVCFGTEAEFRLFIERWKRRVEMEAANDPVFAPDDLLDEIHACSRTGT